MKDSRIGTWGVIALLVVLGLKTLALSQPLATDRFLYLIVVPAYGRLAMMGGIWTLPYGRNEGGLGHQLFRDRKGFSWLPGTCLVLVISGLTGSTGFVKLVATFVFTAALAIYYFHRRLGCITGDMLGALGEVNETAILIVLAAG
jgi:adenosylcobinamide-GDP ribazoletransferase